MKLSLSEILSISVQATFLNAVILMDHNSKNYLQSLESCGSPGPNISLHCASRVRLPLTTIYSVLIMYYNPK